MFLDRCTCLPQPKLKLKDLTVHAVVRSFMNSAIMSVAVARRQIESLNATHVESYV